MGSDTQDIDIQDDNEALSSFFPSEEPVDGGRVVRIEPGAQVERSPSHVTQSAPERQEPVQQEPPQRAPITEPIGTASTSNINRTATTSNDNAARSSLEENRGEGSRDDVSEDQSNDEQRLSKT